MARAGDGARRSERRRLNATISLRVDHGAKQALSRTAQKAGYTSLSAWAADKLSADDSVSPREQRILCGLLGRYGAQLSHLAHRCETMRHAEIRQELETYSQRIVDMQKRIMEGPGDTGEKDQEPSD